MWMYTNRNCNTSKRHRNDQRWAVNPNESNSEYTPIDRAAFNGDVEIVKFWPL